MSEEIRVKVTRHGKRKFLQMYYDDPVTGEREQRSTKKTNRRDAERAAAKWEAELREGRYKRQANITWADFRERCLDEFLAAKPKRTVDAYQTAFNHFERIVKATHLRVVDASVLSRFQAELRRELVTAGSKSDGEKQSDKAAKPPRKRSEASIGAYLRHLKAAFRWAAKMGFMQSAPDIDMPSTGGRRGRPITTEEFERMLAAVPKVRPHDAAVWTHYLNGLWLSGLRLEESTIVSWDQDEPFCVDLSGAYPMFRIESAAQKARRDELLPLTPDFAEFILQTPQDQRHGRLFKLNAIHGGKPISAANVGRVVGEIGEKAGVVIDKDAGKYAGAHDLRRSFGTRWAPKVRPATLQKLMRHTDIKTTMKHYVSLAADDVAAELWGKMQPRIDTFVDTSPKPAKFDAELEPQETTKPVDKQRVSVGS